MLEIYREIPGIWFFFIEFEWYWYWYLKVVFGFILINLPADSLINLGPVVCTTTERYKYDDTTPGSKQ